MSDRESTKGPAAEANADGRGRRIMVAGLLTAAVALVLIALAVNLLDSGGATEAPEEVPFAAAVDVPTGGVASIATVELPNPERLDVTVEEVALARTDGVNYIDGAVVPPADRAEHGDIQYGPQFPPQGWPYDELRPLTNTVPAEEFADAPEEDSTLKLVVAVYPTRDGMVGFNGIEVTYVVGGDRRREVYPHGLVLCSPPASCDGVVAEDALAEMGVIGSG